MVAVLLIVAALLLASYFNPHIQVLLGRYGPSLEDFHELNDSLGPGFLRLFLPAAPPRLVEDEESSSYINGFLSFLKDVMRPITGLDNAVYSLFQFGLLLIVARSWILKDHTSFRDVVCMAAIQGLQLLLYLRVWKPWRGGSLIIEVPAVLVAPSAMFKSATRVVLDFVFPAGAWFLQHEVWQKIASVIANALSVAGDSLRPLQARATLVVERAGSAVDDWVWQLDVPPLVLLSTLCVSAVTAAIAMMLGCRVRHATALGRATVFRVHQGLLDLIRGATLCVRHQGIRLHRHVAAVHQLGRRGGLNHWRQRPQQACIDFLACSRRSLIQTIAGVATTVWTTAAREVALLQRHLSFVLLSFVSGTLAIVNRTLNSTRAIAIAPVIATRRFLYGFAFASLLILHCARTTVSASMRFGARALYRGTKDVHVFVQALPRLVARFSGRVARTAITTQVAYFPGLRRDDVVLAGLTLMAMRMLVQLHLTLIQAIACVLAFAAFGRALSRASRNDGYRAVLALLLLSILSLSNYVSADGMQDAFQAVGVMMAIGVVAYLSAATESQDAYVDCSGRRDDDTGIRAWLTPIEREPPSDTYERALRPGDSTARPSWSPHQRRDTILPTPPGAMVAAERRPPSPEVEAVAEVGRADYEEFGSRHSLSSVAAALRAPYTNRLNSPCVGDAQVASPFLEERELFEQATPKGTPWMETARAQSPPPGVFITTALSPVTSASSVTSPPPSPCASLGSRNRRSLGHTPSRFRPWPFGLKTPPADATRLEGPFFSDAENETLQPAVAPPAHPDVGSGKSSDEDESDRDVVFNPWLLNIHNTPLRAKGKAPACILLDRVQLSPPPVPPSPPALLPSHQMMKADRRISLGKDAARRAQTRFQSFATQLSKVAIVDAGIPPRAPAPMAGNKPLGGKKKEKVEKGGRSGFRARLVGGSNHPPFEDGTRT